MSDPSVPANGSGAPLHALPQAIPRLSPPVRAQVVLALRLAGLKRAEIAQVLGVSVWTVDATEKTQDSRAALRAIREIAKLEFVESALAVQRKYFKALDEMPADKEHAVAHSRYTGALGVIAEKSALAGGEATQRSETTQVTLTLEEKQRLLAQLEEARTLDRERQGLPKPPEKENWWERYIESGEPNNTGHPEGKETDNATL